ncbi:MAG: TIGR04149 family rSAM-modified RiPP [Tannerellaceae bacterium]|jgi:natural product precursor|nr:TIGR04149 family rSAM-modified RiPP [Tannerellaceae bacterium]
MIKLRKMSLSQQSNADLSQREMNSLFGGGTPGCCVCGCAYYSIEGGASAVDNSGANNAYGFFSPGGGVPSPLSQM